MAGDGNFSGKQLDLLAAMVAGRTVVDASKACQVAERTAYRWTKQPEFQDALEQAQQKAFEDKLKLLRTGIGSALSALMRNMDAKASPVLQVRAADIWLRSALELHRAEKLEERIRELEQIVRDKLA